MYLVVDLLSFSRQTSGMDLQHKEEKMQRTSFLKCFRSSFVFPPFDFVANQRNLKRKLYLTFEKH